MMMNIVFECYWVCFDRVAYSLFFSLYRSEAVSLLAGERERGKHSTWSPWRHNPIKFLLTFMRLFQSGKWIPQ